MKPWVFLAIGVGSLWLQLTVVPYAAISGLKPNLMLLAVLLLALRWQEPWLFVYAAIVGLALDVFSHGIVGVYAVSYFLVSLLALYAGRSVYENNLWFTMGAVAGLSLAEGVISSTIFELLDQSTPWWRWFFREVVPVSLYHGLLAPFLLYGLVRLERLLKLTEAIRSRQ
jgi:rod shape-determining protein MreD